MRLLRPLRFGPPAGRQDRCSVQPMGGTMTNKTLVLGLLSLTLVLSACTLP